MTIEDLFNRFGELGGFQIVKLFTPFETIGDVDPVWIVIVRRRSRQFKIVLSPTNVIVWENPELNSSIMRITAASAWLGSSLQGRKRFGDGKLKPKGEQHAAQM